MRTIRKIHKWASLFVGLQLLIWLGSGLYFNLMDHHTASGNQYRKHLHQASKFERTKLIESQQILAKTNAATSIKITELLGQPYYLVNHERGLYPHFNNRYSLYHAYTGQPIQIDKAFAAKLARHSYSGPGEVSAVRYFSGGLEDIPKQQNASWQVNFNDAVNTSVYIEVESGRIVGHSDDDKRFSDIFFMLHFMDYGNQGSFNNIQIILFAFVTLWLSITGIIWTVNLANRGQYKIKWLSGS